MPAQLPPKLLVEIVPLRVTLKLSWLFSTVDLPVLCLLCGSCAEQARVGILMLALLFFNNVFFGAQIFSPFPRFFFRSCHAIFLNMYLQGCHPFDMCFHDYIVAMFFALGMSNAQVIDFVLCLFLNCCSLYVIFVATFLALMLFFWLELFGDLAAGNMQVRGALKLLVVIAPGRKFRNILIQH